MVVLAVGDCAVDVYAHVDQLPAFGEKLAGRPVGIFGSGVAANFACALARYGQAAALLGAVGDDSFGHVAVESLKAFGVEADGVVVRPGAATSWNFVALGPAGEKALTILPSDTFFPRYEWIDPARVEAAKHLHIAPFDMVQALLFAEKARSWGLTVSADLEPAMLRATTVGKVLQFIGLCDVVSLNEHACLEMFGEMNVYEGLRELRALGPSNAIATLGEEGSVLVTDGGVYEIPCVRTESLIDTTGAGDCYNATFLANWLEGMAPTKAAELASVAASLSIEALGAREGYATRERIEQVTSPLSRRLG